MTAVPVVSRANTVLLPLIGADGHAMPTDESTRLQRSLETLFPDMLVHGTHSTLLGMTTSLTKASNHTHQYFSRVSQILAFERMMRSFMKMTAAMSPFPVDYGAANYWAGMFLPQTQTVPSPWAFPMHQPKPAPALPFFSGSFQPKPPTIAVPSAMDLLSKAFQPQATSANASVWPDYSELMIVPMALMMAAPSVGQIWGKGF